MIDTAKNNNTFGTANTFPFRAESAVPGTSPLPVLTVIASSGTSVVGGHEEARDVVVDMRRSAGRAELTTWEDCKLARQSTPRLCKWLSRMKKLAIQVHLVERKWPYSY